MAEPFLDTNILVRHLAGDHARLSPVATAIVGRIESGELAVRTSDTVIFETVFLLDRSYRVPRITIAAILSFDTDFDRVPGITRREA